jgi:hypothetical protein
VTFVSLKTVTMFKLIALACIFGLCAAHYGQWIKVEICYDETGMDCTSFFAGCVKDDPLKGHLCDRDGNYLEFEYYPKTCGHHYCGCHLPKVENSTNTTSI